MKPIGLATSSFESLVEDGYIYVDKTSYIYRMVRESRANNFYFISRPRRFGKSLMCSTLEALFLGKRELFEGLYIAGTGYEFKKYPVLRFDFARLNCSTFEDFISDFSAQIADNAKPFGIGSPSGKPSAMLDFVLGAMDERAVIIIDEFDSPIIDAVSRSKAELAEQMRTEFNAFYKVIKSRSDKVRFFFMTGCTPFNIMNEFSGMNNVIDISFDQRYAGMFGYTEEELETYFSEYIDAKYKATDGKCGSREDFLAELRKNYGGYRFSPKREVRVYNPVSIGNYFSDSMVDFSNYWFENGGMSTLAMTLAKNADLIRFADDSAYIMERSLSRFDISVLAEGPVSKEQTKVVLYYSGYLTIISQDPPVLLLGFPNTEVGDTFTEMLAQTSPELVQIRARSCAVIS